MVYIKLLFALVLIVLLMRLSVGIGTSLICASVLIGFLFFKDYLMIPETFFHTVTSYTTIKTLLIVYGVLLLSYVMKERQVNRMMSGLTHLIKNIKYAIILPPMFIGLLPMPGGAMLPAAIIENMGSPLNLSPEKKTFINYWFRHIWEYFWPLYPGLILTASIMQIGIKEIMLRQFYLTIIVFITGMAVIFSIKSKRSEDKEKNIKRGIFSLVRSILPIIIMILLILFTSIREEMVVIGVTLLYLVFSKSTFKSKIKAIYKSASLDALILIFGVMVFKDFLLASSALNFIAESAGNHRGSLYLLLMILPAMIGFLTGINQAYVGIVLPIVMTFMFNENNSVDYTKLTLFYASGFAGVLLSPVHLCLSLTKEYYKAKWSGIYKILIPAVIPVLAAPIVVYLLSKL